MAAEQANVPVAWVGKFNGLNVRFGRSETPLTTLEAHYNLPFETLFG